MYRPAIAPATLPTRPLVRTTSTAIAIKNSLRFIFSIAFTFCLLREICFSLSAHCSPSTVPSSRLQVHYREGDPFVEGRRLQIRPCAREGYKRRATPWG